MSLQGFVSDLTDPSSITSPLLAAYVENLFSRAPLVGGRTVSGLVVGLGDEGVGELALYPFDN